jgi:hypothetical protein
MHLRGLERSRCGVALRPEAKLVVIDDSSKAWVQNQNTNGFESPIVTKREGGILIGGVRRVRSLGAELIAVTGGRGVCVRIGVAAWVRLGPEIPYTYSLDNSSSSGFEDIDAFSDGDMYAVGGAGDIWHFNGQQWRQCAFPSNWGLSAVCCAPDGHVYVSAGAGSVFRGRGDRWKLIHTDKLTVPHKDLVWYEGKLWCTNDYGVWTIEDGVFSEASVPSDVKLCSGNLAARDGVLLLAGFGGAAFLRDGKWTVAFHDHVLRQRAAS